MNENIIPEGNAGAPQLSATTPEGTVGSVAAPASTITLEELNTLTGKQFPTKEAALKSIKDTASYVGMKVEDVEKRVLAKAQESNKTDALALELETMRKERFFDKNPQYADENTRKIIERLGGNPVDVVASPEFKSVFEKVQGYDETQKLKTVLDSNPRLASSRDNLTKARELKAQGATTDQISQLAVNAVKDAYGL
jgi:hypothetical protein